MDEHIRTIKLTGLCFINDRAFLLTLLLEEEPLELLNLAWLDILPSILELSLLDVEEREDILVGLIVNYQSLPENFVRDGQ